MRAPKEHPEAAEKTFCFRLARDLGLTVAELERRLSVAEFGEWAAFYAAEAKVEAMAQRQAERTARARKGR